MKFSCEKALLLGAVSTASRAVAVKSSIPALEGILIEAGEQLRLTGYNLETGIRAAVPAEIREKGSLVLSARLFGEIIRKMPDDVVVFTSENYMVNIKCGLSEFNILGTDPEEFPELPSVEEQNGLTIGQPVLRSMIAQTLFAVSDNESRPVHTGSLFEVDESGLTVVSVDGYRLALRHEPVDSSQGVLPFSFVVPGSALSEVEKICAGEDAVSVAQGARHIQFQAGDTVLVCRRLEGEFLAYKNAIPRNNTIKIEGDARTLLQSIERVSLKLRDRSAHRVDLRIFFQKFQLFLASVRHRKIIRIHPCDPFAETILEPFIQRFPETAVFRKADYAKDHFLVVVFLSLTFLRIFSLYLAFLTSISLLIVFRWVVSLQTAFPQIHDFF